MSVIVEKTERQRSLEEDGVKVKIKQLLAYLALNRLRSKVAHLFTQLYGLNSQSC